MTDDELKTIKKRRTHTMSDPECKPASPEFTIDDKLRHMISRSLDIADLYKTALGTIVEQRSCIEDWQRRSQEWCDKCDKASELEACEASRRELTLLLVDARSVASKAKSDLAELRGELREQFDTPDNDLPLVNKLRRSAASSPYGYCNVAVEQANDLAREVESLRQHRDRLEKQIDSAVVAQEDYARRCSRDAFLDGANWLEHRLRDKPLSAYYTRMAWEEACKRWGEEGRDGRAV